MSILVNFISDSIQFFYNITAISGIPNYGFAIILFTVFIKLLLFPLTSIQVKSMRAMQELQPKLKEIQTKYKNDQQKAQQAMMELYQKNKVNPFSGCLPLLVQMPILFALFTALRTFFDPKLHPAYVNLEHATFFWIPNLGVPDPLYILPILAAVFTFVQQKASTPNNTDPTQKTMLYIMPLFMGWIAKSFASGLALYWVVYSIVSALEQFLLKKQRIVAKEEVAER
ncbi:YidC/Oxa1 family membrane protein insertase [Bacillota bacterium LX-D]|nr:YidC/Oxa1 family membrane protein insertase [Bacillota bacterium LX-D]